MTMRTLWARIFWTTSRRLGFERTALAGATVVEDGPAHETTPHSPARARPETREIVMRAPTRGAMALFLQARVWARRLPARPTALPGLAPAHQEQDGVLRAVLAVPELGDHGLQRGVDLGLLLRAEQAAV